MFAIEVFAIVLAVISVGMRPIDGLGRNNTIMTIVVFTYLSQ